MVTLYFFALSAGRALKIEEHNVSPDRAPSPTSRGPEWRGTMATRPRYVVGLKLLFGEVVVSSNGVACKPSNCQQIWTKCQESEATRLSCLRAFRRGGLPDRPHFAVTQTRVGCIDLSEFGLSRTRIGLFHRCELRMSHNLRGRIHRPQFESLGSHQTV